MAGSKPADNVASTANGGGPASQDRDAQIQSSSRKYDGDQNFKQMADPNDLVPCEVSTAAGVSQDNERRITAQPESGTTSLTAFRDRSGQEALEPLREVDGNATTVVARGKGPSPFAKSDDVLEELSSSSKLEAVDSSSPSKPLAVDVSSASKPTSIDQKPSIHIHTVPTQPVKSGLDARSPRTVDRNSNELDPQETPQHAHQNTGRPASARAASVPTLKARRSITKAFEESSHTGLQVKTTASASGLPHANAMIASPHSPRRRESRSTVGKPGLPFPPGSVPAHLQYELAGVGRSHSRTAIDNRRSRQYEATAVKLERLKNFLMLPPHLEQVLVFGTLACLDAWLYMYTILPLRFVAASGAMFRAAIDQSLTEIRFLFSYIFTGLGRVYRRRQSVVLNAALSPLPGSKDMLEGSASRSRANSAIKETFPSASPLSPPGLSRGSSSHRSHRRPHARRKYSLSVSDKADLLKGYLILSTSFLLLYFDASTMYHSIRGQATIKLYVIFNVLEVLDRLLAALGQDILECLLAPETLEHLSNGRSQFLKPFALFLLALVYNVAHTAALLYQAVTLNVAVNSYSNALLTLLMSNQFVEIKSTVFKKFDRDNLFQMTCADVVERFQLWLMLVIIAARNFVETGGVTVSGAASASEVETPRIVPSNSLLPHSFTVLPEWTGQVVGPFVIVLGTEMLIDWLKHAYITKFNNTRPKVYGRFLDVLAKDYYYNAFSDPNLTRRVGLPVFPLTCLAIRASIQTYQMFVAIYFPPALLPNASSTDSGLPTSPSTTAVIEHVDALYRPGSTILLQTFPVLRHYVPSSETTLKALTTILVVLLIYLVLLALKLLLGMGLLALAHRRCAAVASRDSRGHDFMTEGRRLGVWGIVEVGEERKRWIAEPPAHNIEHERETERDRHRERERERPGGLHSARPTRIPSSEGTHNAASASTAEPDHRTRDHRERQRSASGDGSNARDRAWSSSHDLHDKSGPSGNIVHDRSGEGGRVRTNSTTVQDKAGTSSTSTGSTGGHGHGDASTRDDELFAGVERYKMVAKRIW